MSTLHEIAANHARMAKAKEPESTGLGERQPHVVGNIEISSVDELQPMPMHLLAGGQDSQHGGMAGFAL
ncbi:hypothetical protein ABVN23_22105 [Pseudomonas fluorescens]|uniref:hypothetical protein n=1 Tax=Pseudomonas fluorescens TaxID=294 RepID=UPI00048133EF